MTNPNIKNQPEPRPSRRRWRSLILSGVGLGIVTLTGAVVTAWWVQEKLAPLVETEISQLLKRPVQVGRLQRFSLTGLRFGRSSIPATSTDPDRASAEAVEVHFSLGDLIFRRTLKLNITLVNSDAYIEQDASGKWINIETAKGPEGAIKTEIDTIGVQNANAVLVPSPAVGQKTSAPILVNIKEGQAQIREQNQRIIYELNGGFVTSGNFRVKADSLLPTGETNVLLQGQNLPVAELARLLKTPAIRLVAGRGNGNLTVQLRQNQLSDITGVASFEGVEASINPLKQSLKNTSGAVRFKGSAIAVDNLVTNYAEIPVKIAGTILTGPNFDVSQTQFDLTTNVQPVTVAALLNAANKELTKPLQLPIPVTGEVKVDAKLTGDLFQPLLSGAIATTKPVQIDRLQFSNVSTNFALQRGNRGETGDPKNARSPHQQIPPFSSLAISLSNIKVTPTLGGQITGKGQVGIALGGGKLQSGLVLDVLAQNLPADAIANLYKVSIPAGIAIGNISAKTQIFGPIDNIQGRVQWQAPQATYPASGEIRIARLAADLQNVAIAVAGGTVNVSAALNNRRWQALVIADRVSINRLRSEISTLPIPPGLEGLLNGRVLASGTLDNLNLKAITARGNGSLATAGGIINGRGLLESGRWQAIADSDAIAIASLADLGLPILNAANPEPNNLKTQLQNLKSLEGKVSGQVRALGSLDNSNLNAIAADGRGRIAVGGGILNASGKLESGRWQAIAQSDAIALNPIIDAGLPLLNDNIKAQLPTLRSLNGRLSGQIRASGPIENLTANTISAFANGRIITERLGAIAAQGELANSRWQAFVETNNLPLNRLEQPLRQTGLLTQSLPSEIDGLLDGKVRLSGNLNNLTENAIAALGEGQLRLNDNGGIVNARGNLTGGNWRASIAGDRVALSRFQKVVEAQRSRLRAQGLISQAQNLPILGGLFSGQINLLGNLAFSPQTIRAAGSLRVSELPILKQPFAAVFNWNGKQVQVENAVTPGLSANGFFGVEFEGKKLPSISNLDFNVKLSNFDLQALALPTPTGLQNVTSSPLLAGRANFVGRVSGTLDDINLIGNVQLRDFAVNQVAFDPVLSGTVNAGLGRGVDLRLAGQQDRIQAVLDRSYLPTSFLIRRGDAIASGRTEGDILRINLEQFPLATLNLSPAKAQGLGPITGLASGQINIPGWKSPLNLAALQAVGQIAIAQPAIGYIKADSFQGQFNYANGVATLANGELRSRQSQYLISATAKVGNNPQFQAKINAQQGNLQDILVALQYFNLKDIARGLKAPVYATAADVQTAAVGMPDAPLIEQLRRFAEIQVLLAQQREARESSKLPPLSELQGVFGGEIAVAGSLGTGVQAQFNIAGNNWRWGRYVADLFSVEGSFKDGTLTVLPLQIKSGETLIGFSGQIGQNGQSGQLRARNVPVEELAKIVELPYVDVTGNLNLKANIAGSLQNPQATGELSLVNGTINREPIENAEGSFSYTNARLNFSGSALVTKTEPINVQGSLPFELPFAKVKPDSDQIALNVNLKNEGLTIINVLTPEIAWVDGKGQVQLRVGGTLQRPAAEGIATFENATVRARAFPDPLTGLTGIVRFEGDRIRVEGIKGLLSKGQVTAAGTIPLAAPLAEGDRDRANPLTVALDKLSLNLKGLYRGGANGQVVVGGTALRPRLAGSIELANGQIFLPGAGSGTTLVSTTAGGNQAFEVGFDNLRLNLGKGIQVTSPPILSFAATGGLTVNGTIDDIRPQGTIKLTAGAVNLFTTQFRLDRGYPQTATFVPSQRLDPTLDVRLVTSVPEVTRFVTPATALSSEIADNPRGISSGSVRSIRIQALARGRASQLADNIELRSSPSRSETELVALLGGSFVQTLGAGDSTLAIANLAGAGLFSNLQSAITNATGLTEFRLFPTRIRNEEGRSSSSSTLGLGLEVGLDITRNLSASVIRVLAPNQPTDFTLRYRLNDEILLRGSTNLQGDTRATVEYEVRF